MQSSRCLPYISDRSDFLVRQTQFWGYICRYTQPYVKFLMSIVRMPCGNSRSEPHDGQAGSDIFFSQFWIVHWYIFQQTGLHAFWCLSFYSNECDFILSPKHLFVLPSFFRSYLNPSLAKTSTTPCDSVSLLNPIIMYTQHAHLPINQRTRRHLSTHINTDFLTD